MRDAGRLGASRVKGRAALVRRLRGLLLAAGRFSVRRAVTAEDRRVAAVLVDGLRHVLVEAERTPNAE